MFRHTDGRRNSSGKTTGQMLMGRVVVLAACLFALAWSHRASAQTAETAPPRAQVERLDAAAGERIELYAGGTLLLKVDWPMKRAMVGDPRVAEVTIISPQQAMISARGVGATGLVLWDANEKQVSYEILVQMDLAQLRAAIADTAPGSKVDVKTLGEKIVLTGTVPDVDTMTRVVQLAELLSGSQGMASVTGGQTGGQVATLGGSGGGAASGGNKAAAQIVNHLVVAGEHQIVLRCTVAEVSKTAIRQLGINGWLAGDNIRDVFAVNQIGAINPVNIGAGTGQNIIQPGGLHFATGDLGETQGLSLQTTSNFSVGFPRVQMQLFFRAMRENRLVRVLAEPNLVAISGQEASFLAGGEFPYQVPQSLGTTTIEWKDFGIKLRFTPTAIGRQMIRLRVAPEVSDLDFANGVALTGGVVVPAITSRRVETTIELASGSTIAIAGLLSDRVQSYAQKTPGLGDVPVLGAMFSSVEYRKFETELVVLVTPELISALQPDQVNAVPGQNMRHPSDWELFGLGMLEGQPAADAADTAAALQTQTAPRYPKSSSPPDQMSLHGPWGPADQSESDR